MMSVAFFSGLIFLFVLPLSGPPLTSKPENLNGCYSNKNAPSLEIKENLLIIHQKSRIVTQFSYRIDNTSKLIYTEKPIILHSADDHEFKYILDSENQKFIRVYESNNPRLEVLSSNSFTTVYEKNASGCI
jgi:hypothetical protein